MGDRYYSESGANRSSFKGQPDWEITLIESEVTFERSGKVRKGPEGPEGHESRAYGTHFAWSGPFRTFRKVRKGPERLETVEGALNKKIILE